MKQRKVTKENSSQFNAALFLFEIFYNELAEGTFIEIEKPNVVNSAACYSEIRQALCSILLSSMQKVIFNQDGTRRWTRLVNETFLS